MNQPGAIMYRQHAETGLDKWQPALRVALCMATVAACLLCAASCQTQPHAPPCECGLQGREDVSPAITVNHYPKSPTFDIRVRGGGRKLWFVEKAAQQDLEALAIRMTIPGETGTRPIPWKDIVELPCCLLAERKNDMTALIQRALWMEDGATRRDLVRIIRDNRPFMESEATRFEAQLAERDRISIGEPTAQNVAVLAAQMKACATRGDPKGVVRAFAGIRQQKPPLTEAQLERHRANASEAILNAILKCFDECRAQLDKGSVEEALARWEHVTAFKETAHPEWFASKKNEWERNLSIALRKIINECLAMYGRDAEQAASLKDRVTQIAGATAALPREEMEGFLVAADDALRRFQRKEARRQRDYQKRGWVEYEGEWMPPAQREALQIAAVAEERVRELSLKAEIRVTQVVQDGILTVTGKQDRNGNWVDSDTIVLVSDADPSVYMLDRQYRPVSLYWCGNYSYMSPGGKPMTVFKYSVDRDRALKEATDMYRKEMGLASTRRKEATGPRPVAAGNAD